jgi:hypothetical protein
MIKRAHVLQEYNFGSEVAPIVLAAVLLNVAGRQLGDYAHLDFIFVDMSGTAFCALLLGPWWAAAVAAASSTINGNFFTNYFAFGIVNIVGGIAWGYLARAVDWKRFQFARNAGHLARLILITLALGVAGGIVCAFTSSILKLVLYPEMGRSFIHSQFEIATQNFLRGELGYNPQPVLVLFLTDLQRDVLDKVIGVSIAGVLAWITCSRAFPAGQPSSHSMSQRIRTDYLSILLFVAIYSAYLALARLLTPVIIFGGGQTELSWLESPNVIAILFAPVLLALLVFLFGTYRSDRPSDCQIDLNRQMRRQALRALNRPPAPQQATGQLTIAQRISVAGSTTSRFGLEPLALAASFWPARNAFGSDAVMIGAIAAAGIAVAAFVLSVRRALPRLERTMNNLATLRSWLKVGNPPHETADVLGLLSRALRENVFVPEQQVSRVGPVTCVFGFEDRRGQEHPSLIGVIDSPAGLDLTAAETIRTLVARLGVRQVILATTTSRILDPEVAGVLQRITDQSAVGRRRSSRTFPFVGAEVGACTHFLVPRGAGWPAPTCGRQLS